MTRVSFTLLVLVSTAAASPAPPLPIPPIPPANPPSDHAAPMPDRSLEGPSTENGRSVQVNVSDFRIERFYQGLGYGPGSHYETSEEKRPIQTPGVTLKVPLQ
jgi:hypothetical protein